MQRLVTAMTRDIGVRVLGPVEVRTASGWLTAPPQQRLLLSLLVLQVGQVIPVGELIDAIWPDAPPTSARASVQVMVTRLRQILAGLPGGVVERCGDGYRLVIAPCSTDVEQFRLLTRAARDTPDPAEAVATFDRALSLWRGPALADVPDTAKIDGIRVALAEERFSATQDRIGALLVIGRDGQAAEELTGLVAAYPLAERLAGLLMVALSRCGRQADALQIFRDLRGRLCGELAIEPGRDLQRLHQQILAGDLAPTAATGWLIRPDEQLTHGQELTAAGHDPQSVPRQLPTGVAHFTGRAAELRVLDSLLAKAGSAGGSVPISVISGTAGVGKTALALHWAHQSAQEFPDGQLYVNLRAFGASRGPARAADVIRAFLDALGVPRGDWPAGIDAQAALYRSALAGKRLLVMLDNAADEEQVRPLLPGSATCLVLMTSRRRLAGLAASEGASLITLEVMSEPEALELLAARLGNERTAGALEAVSQLATLCARLPLALSVAAVRGAESTNADLAALASRMQDAESRLDVLDLGERDGNTRAVFSWSYKKLSRPAARMFRLLALHPGPDIGIGAAASLLGCQVGQARQYLAELADAHVITEHIPGRWTLHDLLRAYANELARSEEDRDALAAATQRVLDYYVQAAWSAAVVLCPHRDPAFVAFVPAGSEPDCLDGPDEAMAWFGAEHQVLVDIISWAAAAGSDAHAWRLAWALNDYLTRTERWDAQRLTMEIALEAALRSGDKAGLARAHHGLGCAQLPPDAGIAGHEHLDQALALYRELNDLNGQALIHFQFGMIFEREGRNDEALGQGLHALKLARASGHRFHEANALNMIGWLHAQLGHYELALKRCRQALVLHRALGNRLGQAATWDSIAYVSHQLGNYALAARRYQRALNLSRELDCRGVQAAILDHQGDNCNKAAFPAAARDFWEQALAILDDLGSADANGIRRKLLAVS